MEITTKEKIEAVLDQCIDGINDQIIMADLAISQGNIEELGEYRFMANQYKSLMNKEMIKADKLNIEINQKYIDFIDQPLFSE